MQTPEPGFHHMRWLITYRDGEVETKYSVNVHITARTDIRATIRKERESIELYTRAINRPSASIEFKSFVKS